MTGTDEHMGAVEQHALLYMMANIVKGVVHVSPEIHGVYDTYQEAADARATKVGPEDYYVRKVSKRRFIKK